MDLQEFRVTFWPEKVACPRREGDDLYEEMEKCPASSFLTAPFLHSVKRVIFHVSGPARSHGISHVLLSVGKGL